MANIAADPVPLSQWMEEALYHPERGYYSRQIRTVGRGGDFSTTATLTPVLGRAIARWIRKERADNQIRDVIEVGAGDGSLLASVRSARLLAERFGKNSLRFHVVEASPILRAQQQSRFGRGVRWHDDVGSALQYCQGHALLYSNELVDAFPVTQLRWNGDAWEEIWLQPRTDAPPREVLLPLGPGLNKARFSALDLESWSHPPRERHRVDLHPSYRNWQAEWLPKLSTGSLLTIDYGGESPALPQGQPGGSLRAYFRHQRITGPDIYQNKGHQDLTADVNFTDLSRWGSELGLQNVSLQSQREFLLERLPELAKSTDAAVKMILHPDGAGAAFQVLLQRVPV